MDMGTATHCVKDGFRSMCRSAVASSVDINNTGDNCSVPTEFCYNEMIDDVDNDGESNATDDYYNRDCDDDGDFAPKAYFNDGVNKIDDEEVVSTPDELIHSLPQSWPKNTKRKRASTCSLKNLSNDEILEKIHKEILLHFVNLEEAPMDLERTIIFDRIKSLLLQQSCILLKSIGVSIDETNLLNIFRLESQDLDVNKRESVHQPEKVDESLVSSILQDNNTTNVPNSTNTLNPDPDEPVERNESATKLKVMSGLTDSSKDNNNYADEPAISTILQDNTTNNPKITNTLSPDSDEPLERNGTAIKLKIMSGMIDSSKDNNYYAEESVLRTILQDHITTNTPNSSNILNHDSNEPMKSNNTKIKLKIKPRLVDSSEGNIHYECKECRQIFTDFRALGGHMASHNRKNMSESENLKHGYECKECNEVFDDFRALGGHKASHNRKKRTHEAAFAGGESRSTESGDCGREKRFACNICPRTFSTGQALGGHKTFHRKIAESSGRIEAICSAQVTCSAQDPVSELDLNAAPDNDGSWDYW